MLSFFFFASILFAAESFEAFRSQFPADVQGAIELRRCKRITRTMADVFRTFNYRLLPPGRAGFDTYMKQTVIARMQALYRDGDPNKELPALEQQFTEIMAPLMFLDLYSCRVWCRGNPIAEDIINHSLANLLRAIRRGSYDPTNSTLFTTYAGTALRRTSNRYSKYGDRKNFETEIGAIDDSEKLQNRADKTASSPALRVAISDAAESIEMIYRSLSDPERYMLRERGKGRPLAEIGREFGTTGENIRQRSERALKKLSEGLNARMGNEAHEEISIGIDTFLAMYDADPSLFPDDSYTPEKKVKPIAPTLGPEDAKWAKPYIGGLTDRERRVLQLRLAGKTVKEVSRELNITETTVTAEIGNGLRLLSEKYRKEISKPTDQEKTFTLDSIRKLQDLDPTILDR